MKGFAFTIFFIFAFAVQVVYSCSFRTEPLPDFDETEYIFIGEVIGYTEPQEFNRKIPVSTSNPYYQLPYKQASGLIVKVKESVYLPKTPKSHFEVFLFDTDGACFRLGYSSQKLERMFPLNSEIMVVAKDAKEFPHILPDGNFRIERRNGEWHLIALNSTTERQRKTIMDSFFDYQRVKDFPSLFNASIFEIRKDLFRLKIAQTWKEKQEVLDRLFYFDKLYVFVEFYNLTQKYMSNANKAEEFFRKHLRLAGFSEQIIEEERIRRQRQLKKHTRN